MKRLRARSAGVTSVRAYIVDFRQLAIDDWCLLRRTEVGFRLRGPEMQGRVGFVEGGQDFYLPALTFFPQRQRLLYGLCFVAEAAASESIADCRLKIERIGDWRLAVRTMSGRPAVSPPRAQGRSPGRTR